MIFEGLQRYLLLIEEHHPGEDQEEPHAVLQEVPRHPEELQQAEVGLHLHHPQGLKLMKITAAR
jgi:hypothetical protein